jgi:hypothetical protein
VFAAFLGFNPIEHLVGAHALATVSVHNHALLIGRTFFPHLISSPFRSGLHEAFGFAIVACLVAAAASLMRGGRYYDAEEPRPVEPARLAVAPARLRAHPPTPREEQHAG